MTKKGISKDNKNLFNAIHKRAQKLGVLDMSFDDGNNSPSDSIECYKRILDFIEENKNILDRNAGEYKE
jgi:hypothetical protein